MSLIIKLLPRGTAIPSHEKNVIYLTIDHWDDYSYKTLFSVKVADGDGELHGIGAAKIGYINQEYGYTKDSLLDEQNALNSNYFSLGRDVSYYKNVADLPGNLPIEFCQALQDVVSDNQILNLAKVHDVFKTSLLRDVSYSSIHEQFSRVLNGGALLTCYKFSYKKPHSEKNAAVDLSFSVIPESKPSTNIHILIGRNGVGKTQILNDMVCAIFEPKNIENHGSFYKGNKFSDLEEVDIPAGYFSAVVSIAFSAFDPFLPPKEKTDPLDLTKYFYVGLKNSHNKPNSSEYSLKTMPELKLDFSVSLALCLSEKTKRSRWLKAISMLESDLNFSDMRLADLATIDDNNTMAERAKKKFERMSSGHAIVLLSITRLVERLEEKTLVLIDEPESHLHPPLLSAFIRALSDLLVNRNAVAIIATHSPVILQEVPKSCVWKLRRSKLEASAHRPENETFGENVGTLTRDVFGLEVEESGFIRLLKQGVALSGSTYESILEDFNDEIGFEGRSILRALIIDRDSRGLVQ